MYNMSPYSLSRSFRDKPCRAVIYGRASTEHEAQVKALQNQMQWYDDVARFHPQWNVISRYIDQGITGTQVYKRDAFMQMMEDAKQHKFDLIVTREVCRFARNTVDALVCVRQLAAMGIEVYFVNDNIWTLDGDGELRLTIMATMAQEESRKISERSLAGQRVSREKGVLYGNGNIFGYTRNKLTKQFEIDPDQAETVKMIFDLYDSGMGETLVAKELTRLGRKNGVGKVKWDAGKVSKIIKRKNYLGYTVYCQSYSNNYLEQKRIKRDESEFVYVKGGFPQIISEEQYERCNAIRRSRTKRLTDEKGRTRSFGIQQAQNVWGRKMRCRCGSPMLRHRWRTNNAGKPIYGYECKRHHDTPRIRLQNEQGNPTPICEIKPVGQSKLELMASKIFERVWGDQREIVLQTCKMLDACYKPDADRRADLMKAKDDSIQLLQQQLDDLVVVRARGEIEQDTGGHIYVNDIDIADISFSSLQQQISAVFQDFIRYPFTVAENIAIHDADHIDDPNKVKMAAAHAEATSFIDTLPQGYQTTLEKEWNEGTELSGGQWQKIAIARCFYKPSSVLILDEPFSAIDSFSEKSIIKSLASDTVNKMCIFVTHRFNNICLADQILVLKDAQLIEHGTHAQLMATNGLYAKLYHAQADAFFTLSQSEVTED